jgi:lactoylglutathione lyase
LRDKFHQSSDSMKKFMILCCLLCSLTFVRAQDSASFHFTLNHLALCVKDVDRAAEFYATVLKLPEITNRTKMEGIRWFSLGEGKELHLISTIKEPHTINKAIHVGLTLPNFDDFVKRLDQMKIVYSDWPGTLNKINVRADGVKQIYFQDPDGYWIEVNSAGQR